MTVSARLDNMRVISAPRGPERTAKSWLTEAPLRMLMNNLDPDVAVWMLIQKSSWPPIEGLGRRL